MIPLPTPFLTVDAARTIVNFRAPVPRALIRAESPIVTGLIAVLAAAMRGRFLGPRGFGPILSALVLSGDLLPPVRPTRPTRPVRHAGAARPERAAGTLAFAPQPVDPSGGLPTLRSAGG